MVGEEDEIEQGLLLVLVMHNVMADLISVGSFLRYVITLLAICLFGIPLSLKRLYRHQIGFKP